MVMTKDGYRGGAQGSPTSKVFGGNGKNHDGGSVAKAMKGPGVLNGTGDRDEIKSPKTPASNMSRSAYKGGSTTPSAARRRSGG
jgi:hypothetical protein